MKKTNWIPSLLILAIIAVALTGTMVTGHEKSKNLVDLITCNGEIGTADATLNLSVFESRQPNSSFYEVSGTIQLNEEEEQHIYGYLHPSTGEFFLQTSNNQRIHGHYDEDYGLMEGILLEDELILAFNWQL